MTAKPSATGATGLDFISTAYRYHAVVSADLGPTQPRQATQPWDGEARIDAGGPRTDSFSLPDGRLVFVYGATTDLALPAYATAGQQLKATWHGCPTTPDRSTDVDFASTPALIFEYDCGGLHLISLYVVNGGFGLVVNMMNPPGHGVDDLALFRQVIADWSWAQ